MASITKVEYFASSTNTSILPNDTLQSQGRNQKKFIRNKDIESELMHSYILFKRHTDGVLVNMNRYALMAIDTAKLKDVKFYRDNTFDDGKGNFFAVFATQNIIPTAISVVAHFNV